MGILARITAQVYDILLSPIEERVLQHRRRHLLAPLRGRILEIGAGTGVNFSLYHPETKVLAVEPDRNMLAQAQKRLPAQGHIQLKRTGVGKPNLEELIEPHSFDAIVCTLVLCSLPDLDLAFRSFHTWLKPGGKLVVIEHIRSPHHTRAKVQDLFNPAWKAVASGCNLNRRTDVLIKKAGFEVFEEAYFNMGLSGYQGVFIRPGGSAETR